MANTKKMEVPDSIRTAVNTLLAPYGQEWNPQTEKPSISHEPDIERPLTRKEAAKILSVSLATVNNYVHSGLLKKILIGPRRVAITPDSVREVLGTIANPNALTSTAETVPVQ